MVINNKGLYLWYREYSKGHYLPILKSAAGQLDAMLSHHSKVLVFRLDFRLHEGTDSNILISEFIRRYRKHSVRHGVNRLGYLWCREQATKNKPHYHCAFFVNGHVHQHPHNLIEQARYYWETWECGSLSIPKNPYLLVGRNDEEAYQQAFNRISYLAKVGTKGDRPPTTNDYSSSRIKPKEI